MQKKQDAVNKFISVIPRKIFAGNTDETLWSKNFSNGYNTLLKDRIGRKKVPQNFSEKYMMPITNSSGQS